MKLRWYGVAEFCILAVVLLTVTQALPVNRISQTSERLTLEPIPPENTNITEVCEFNNELYAKGQRFTTTNPCETCVCHAPGFACSLRTCDVKPGCRAIHTADKCCPEYTCECEKDGRVHGNGEKVEEPNPCKVCYCKGGDIKCALITCYTRDDCEPRIVEGRCCPKYDHCPTLETMKNKTTTLKPALVVISDLTTDIGINKAIKEINRMTPTLLPSTPVTTLATTPNPGPCDCREEATTVRQESATFPKVATLEIIEIYPSAGVVTSTPSYFKPQSTTVPATTISMDCGGCSGEGVEATTPETKEIETETTEASDYATENVQIEETTTEQLQKRIGEDQNNSTGEEAVVIEERTTQEPTEATGTTSLENKDEMFAAVTEEGVTDKSSEGQISEERRTETWVGSSTEEVNALSNIGVKDVAEMTTMVADSKVTSLKNVEATVVSSKEKIEMEKTDAPTNEDSEITEIPEAVTEGAYSTVVTAGSEKKERFESEVVATTTESLETTENTVSEIGTGLDITLTEEQRSDLQDVSSSRADTDGTTEYSEPSTATTDSSVLLRMGSTEREEEIGSTLGPGYETTEYDDGIRVTEIIPTSEKGDITAANLKVSTAESFEEGTDAEVSSTEGTKATVWMEEVTEASMEHASPAETKVICTECEENQIGTENTEEVTKVTEPESFAATSVICTECEENTQTTESNEEVTEVTEPTPSPITTVGCAECEENTKETETTEVTEVTKPAPPSATTVICAECEENTSGTGVTESYNLHELTTKNAAFSRLATPEKMITKSEYESSETYVTEASTEHTTDVSVVTSQELTTSKVVAEIKATESSTGAKITGLTIPTEAYTKPKEENVKMEMEEQVVIENLEQESTERTEQSTEESESTTPSTKGVRLEKSFKDPEISAESSSVPTTEEISVSSASPAGISDSTEGLSSSTRYNLAPVLKMLTDQLQFLQVGQEQPDYVVPKTSTVHRAKTEVSEIMIPTSTPETVEMVKVVDNGVNNRIAKKEVTFDEDNSTSTVKYEDTTVDKKEVKESMGTEEENTAETTRFEDVKKEMSTTEPPEEREITTELFTQNEGPSTNTDESVLYNTTDDPSGVASSATKEAGELKVGTTEIQAEISDTTIISQVELTTEMPNREESSTSRTELFDRSTYLPNLPER